MIVTSLLLILVAVALLVAGVVGSANALIVCSIAVTAAAAVVLVAGVRQAQPVDPEIDPDIGEAAPARLAPPPASPARPGGYTAASRRPYDAPAAGATRTATAVRETAGRGGIPAQGGGPDRDPGGPDDPDAGSAPSTGPGGAAGTGAERPGAADDPYDDPDPYDDQPFDQAAYDDEDPPDEPPAQMVPESVASAVALLDTEVMVVDGRPRYHLVSCGHLRGRDSEPISVAEAVELGFSPCGRCEPDNALIEDAGRG